MALSPLNLLLISLSALRSNPLRSLLTTLGIFMGVLAVNSTLQVQAISEQMIESQVKGQISPTISSSISPGITPQQETQLRNQVEQIAASTPMMMGGFGYINYGNQSAPLLSFYTDANYLEITDVKMVAGRFFTSQDVTNFRAVGVLDETTATRLFSDQDPIGRIILFHNQAYRIIGVIEDKPILADFKWEMLLLPVSLAYAQQGNRRIDEWYLQPQDWQQVDIAAEAWEKRVTAEFPHRRMWQYDNMFLIQEQRQVLALISHGLLGVGLIALVISGVGIANITFASVLQRKPEIGLRRAIGATPGDILRQFLLEAIALSFIGGGSAILVVHIAAQGITHYFELPYTFQPRTALISLATATIVGAGSSFFPARRASKIEPMSALRDD